MTHADTCPDAETLAAWYDQGLSPAERARIDVHVSTCERCQPIVAMLARTDVPAVAPAHEARWWSWRWLAPVAAGVAAVSVWAVVRETRTPTASPPAATSLSARAEPAPEVSAPPPTPATTSAPRAKNESTPASSNAPQRVQGDARNESAPAPRAAQAGRRETAAAKQNAAVEQPPPATEPTPAPAPSAAPPASTAPSPAARPAAAARALQATLDAVAAPDIVSPDPSVRWRIRGANVEHTVDGGATWTPQTTGTSAVLTAGASSSPGVCWVVGRGGTVLRIVDGRTWQTVAFPERVDLIRVETSGVLNAIVTTADARRFTTDDGGATWKAGGLQEF